MGFAQYPFTYPGEPVCSDTNAKPLTYRTKEDSEYSSPSEGEQEAGPLSLARGLAHLTYRGLEAVSGDDSYQFPDSQMRFHGKSSGFQLIGEARKLKRMHAQSISAGLEKSPSKVDSDHGTSSAESGASSRRPQFWTTPPVSKLTVTCWIFTPDLHFLSGSFLTKALE